MEQEKPFFSFKNPDWGNRKKQLKASRSQRQNKNMKQICQTEMQSNNKFNYISIEAPPSQKPAKKYCDVTGFEGKYKDKQTQMIYHDRYVYTYIKGLPKPIQDQYLSIRKIVLNN